MQIAPEHLHVELPTTPIRRPLRTFCFKSILYLLTYLLTYTHSARAVDVAGIYSSTSVNSDRWSARRSSRTSRCRTSTTDRAPAPTTPSTTARMSRARYRHLRLPAPLTAPRCARSPLWTRPCCVGRRRRLKLPFSFVITYQLRRHRRAT